MSELLLFDLSFSMPPGTLLRMDYFRVGKSVDCFIDLQSTVGAGLPVISSLQSLLATGDKVHRIYGVLSGTLSYIFNNLSGTESFSTVVKEAKSKGFTEPDPREDLSGFRGGLYFVSFAGRCSYHVKIHFDVRITLEAYGKLV